MTNKRTNFTTPVNKRRRAVLQGTLAGAAGGAAALLRPASAAADSDRVSPVTAEHVVHDPEPAARERRTVKGYISPLYALEFEIEEQKKK